MKTILYLSLFFGYYQTLAQANWILQKNENGIKIYTQSNNESDVKSIKAEVIFFQPLAKVATAIFNVSNYSEWVYQCSVSQLIKQVNDTVLIYRHVTDVPWPFEDRDQVSKFTRINNGKSIIISSSLVTGFPEYKNYVRIQKSEANWELIPQPNGTVKGIYYLSFNPGGNIPVWLINLFIAEGPYQSFVKLKKHLDN